MNTDVATKIDNVIGKEGGYTNDPADSGGETIWGITEFVARSFGYTGRMIDMSRDQAKDIYYKRFWLQPKFDQVAALSDKIAGKLFDAGVNMGVATSSKFLQRALNVLNDNGSVFPDMTVDGAIGNMTLTALKRYLDYRKSDGEVVLFEMIKSQQSVKYIEIAETASKNEKFEYGWQLNRIVS